MSSPRLARNVGMMLAGVAACVLASTGRAAEPPPIAASKGGAASTKGVVLPPPPPPSARTTTSHAHEVHGARGRESTITDANSVSNKPAVGQPPLLAVPAAAKSNHVDVVAVGRAQPTALLHTVNTDRANHDDTAAQPPASRRSVNTDRTAAARAQPTASHRAVHDDHTNHTAVPPPMTPATHDSASDDDSCFEQLPPEDPSQGLCPPVPPPPAGDWTWTASVLQPWGVTQWVLLKNATSLAPMLRAYGFNTIILLPGEDELRVPACGVR
jgi:hypothetical protein